MTDVTIPVRRHLVVEATGLCGAAAFTALALASILHAWAVAAALILAAAAITALSAYDVAAHRLPNRATVGLTAAGAGFAGGLYWAGVIPSLGPVAAGLAVFALIGFAEALHPDGIGGGDAKLLAAIGAWSGLLGWPGLLPTLLGTHLVMIVTLAVGRTHRGGRRVVMGPAMAAGAVAGWLVSGLLL